MQDHMCSALTRGLQEIKLCEAHDGTLSVAAGGPSLEDTYKDLTGHIAAVNGSLSWLLQRGVTPYACGVLDPGAHMADIIEPHPWVVYFVASICHPSVFDKLKKCRVVLWHPSGQPGCQVILQEANPENWLMIAGGSTIGLRWLNLGHALGFRKFELHGLDSSFRDDKTHAYPDRADATEFMEFAGRKTRMNFLGQVRDFMEMLDAFSKENVSIEVHGGGLLQDQWKHYRKLNPNAFTSTR